MAKWNSEKQRQYNKEYREKNKKKLSKRKNQWRKDNLDKHHKYDKKYRNSEKGKQHIKDYRQKHKEKIAMQVKKNQKKWSKTKTGTLSRRKAKLKKRHKLTLEKYDEMAEAQNGLCAICGNLETMKHNKSGSIRRLSVDHNHKTGKLRGLLCANCNLLIGYADENVKTLASAIKYLTKHS